MTELEMLKKAIQKCVDQARAANDKAIKECSENKGSEYYYSNERKEMGRFLMAIEIKEKMKLLESIFAD
jgi:hypothetical protein